MTLTANDISYDPYSAEIDADPYPIFRRMRDEAPLYYNDEHDFYALSRFDDVERGFLDWRTLRSDRSDVLELVKAGVEFPPGFFVFEDPPIHDAHRGLLARIFTPRKMRELEPRLRERCAKALDPLVGSGGFDFVKDLGAVVPMWTIGHLLGIPENDQEAIRDRMDAHIRLQDGVDATAPATGLISQEAVAEVGMESFAEYIDWRADHPADDLMTDLIHTEFEDDKGVWRKPSLDEVRNMITLLAGAGNETTTRLIGFAGQVLAEHPEQLQQIAQNRELIPNTIEELLRFEPPSPVLARYLDRDAEYHGHLVPEGSALLLIVASANRDERRFTDPDRFDIHRAIDHHLAFGFGIHYCLGASLARIEARIALDEVLKRFPSWAVDTDRAVRARTSTVRGWETLPVVIS